MSSQTVETVKACISYRSIDNAASEAGYVAKRLTTYANNLENSVYKKLNNYSGSSTENVRDAKTGLSDKISELRDRSTDFSNYKSSLEDLRDKCESVDKAVKTSVSNLTATFKKNNGIKNNVVQNTLNYWLTSAGNATSAGRWLNDKGRQSQEFKSDLKSEIKKWWNYEGGKQLIGGIAVGLLEITVAVAGVVAAIASGGALVVLIAAVVGGAIAAINGIVNIVNEGRAYGTTQAGDPAMARRQSDMNSIQDTIRAESSSAGWHAFATGLDVTEMVCAIVDLVDGTTELLKKGYKWTTNSWDNLDDIKLKDVLTKDNFKNFGTKLKTEVKTAATAGWTEIKSAFRSKDFTKIKDFAIDFGDDFMNNLKDSFLNIENVEAGAETVENWGDTLKGFMEDGILKTTINSVILPNINVGEVYDLESTQIIGRNTIYTLEPDEIKIGDITDVFFDFKDDVIKSGTWGGIGDLIDAFATRNLINVSIPDISMPPVNVSLPNIDMDKVEIDIPTITVPEIKMPKDKIAKIKIPTITVSKIKASDPVFA